MPSHWETAEENVRRVSNAHNKRVADDEASMTELIAVTRLTVQLAHVAELRAANQRAEEANAPLLELDAPTTAAPASPASEYEATAAAVRAAVDSLVRMADGGTPLDLRSGIIRDFFIQGLASALVAGLPEATQQADAVLAELNRFHGLTRTSRRRTHALALVRAANASAADGVPYNERVNGMCDVIGEHLLNNLSGGWRWKVAKAIVDAADRAVDR